MGPTCLTIHLTKPRSQSIAAHPFLKWKVDMLAPLEISGVFSQDECYRIIAAALDGEFRDAALVGGIQSDNTRRSRLFWLDDEKESGGTFRRLLDTFAKVNRDHFNFVLEEFAERMQVAW